MRSARSLSFARSAVSLSISLGCACFVGDAAVAQAQPLESRDSFGVAETSEIEKLRGLPRFLAELDQLERYGELTVLSATELDELFEKSGGGTVRLLLEWLDGETIPSIEPPSSARVVLLDAALAVYPAWVCGESRAKGGAAERTTRRVLDALSILEVRGGAADLVTARELVDPHDPDERIDRVLTRAYESSLSALLGRDRRAVRKLEESWSEWPPNLWISTVKSVGGSGSPEALDLLTWLLLDAEGTHEFLVQQIGRVVEASRLPGDFALHSILIDLADSEQIGLRREACVTLGKLQCSEAIDVLIDRLRDPQPGVSAAAYWSLQTITGKNMMAEPGRWRSWYAGEERWWRDDFQALRQDLRSDDPAVIGGAIREIGRRKLRRHELADELLPLLDDARESVVCMTIAGLGALGSTVAVEPLIEKLDSQSDAVRELALRALTAITGREDLPADRAAWSDPWRRT